MLNNTKNEILIKEDKLGQVISLFINENRKFLNLDLSLIPSHSSLLADERLKKNIKDNHLIIEIDKVNMVKKDKDTALQIDFKKGDAIQSIIVNPDRIALKHDIEILENNDLNLNMTLPKKFFELVNDKRIEMFPEIKVLSLKYTDNENIRFFRQDKTIYFVDNVIEKDDSFKEVSQIVKSKGSKGNLKFLFDNNQALDLSNIAKDELKIMKEFIKGSVQLGKGEEVKPTPTPVSTPIPIPEPIPTVEPIAPIIPNLDIIDEKLENAKFAIPVFKRVDGKQEKIGDKVTVYGKTENIFSYGTDLASNGQPLMNVSLTKLADGTFSKVLAVNNIDHKFDILNTAGTVQGDEILIELDEFEYNSSTEITASFKKVLEVEGVKYKSIDVLAKDIALSGTKGMKSIFTTEKDKMIDQVIPSNFFELFSQSIIKGEKLPAQQVESLFNLNVELPKGIADINSYLIGKKKINTLTLDNLDPTTGVKKQWLYMQTGTEVYEIDKIYKIPASENNNSALLFGTYLGREKDDAVGENSRVYKIENIDENSADYKRFQSDIIANTNTENQKGSLDVTYEESKDKQITDPIEIRKGKKKIINDAKGRPDHGPDEP
ncbi:MAG: hypothetical protein PHS54_02750, partial [Clostridia bacterium]|nr:hypothetical protein [Clostridia bacterium]